MCVVVVQGQNETIWVDQGIVVDEDAVPSCIAICLDYVFVYYGKILLN